MKTSKLLYLAGIIFYSIVPLVIITNNHLKTDEGGYRLDLIGFFLVALVLYFTVFKKAQHRVNTWDIQNVHKEKVITFRCLKGISFLLILFGVMSIISTNIEALLLTLGAIIVSMIIGWVLQLASVILKFE